MRNMNVCPLCESTGIHDFSKDKQRTYLQCDLCKLVFVPKEFHLSDAEEKAVYDFHENSLTDAGYGRFLSRMLDPMTARLAPGAVGLDFGCGPAPLLAKDFADAGYEVALFDKFYASDGAVLERSYDFITATEVLEHLEHPGEILKQLWSLLNPGGHLGLMTKRVLNRERFLTWHYKNDPTHIVFFCTESFEWLAQTFDATLEILGSDVVILTKTP